MTDNAFWIIIYNTIKGLLDSSTLNPIPDLISNYPPTQQGVPDNPIVLFHNISSRRNGWQGRKNLYNVIDTDFDVTEKYILERVIQVSALVWEDAADLTKSTAVDVINEISSGLMTLSTVENLRTHGIGIFDITNIRTPYFKDEKDLWVMQPNFDFTVMYQNTVEYKAPAASSSTTTINRV